MGQQIIEAGVAPNVISFGWPAWILEQMFAMHDQILANEDNGRAGLATETYWNSEFGVKVLTEWQKWAQDGILFYGGREYSANDPFIAGEFAMLAQSTSSLGGIQNAVEFELGTAFLPTLDGYERNGNNVVGGGCLWTMSGKSDAEYDARRFYQHLSAVDGRSSGTRAPATSATNAAVEALRLRAGLRRTRTSAPPRPDSANDTIAARGVLLGDFVIIRDVVGAAIEDAVVNGVDPQEALDTATEESNQILEDYASLIE